jgi:hypothetical protein
VTALTNCGIIGQRVGNQAFVRTFFDPHIRMASMTFRAAYLCFIQAIPVAAVVKIILVLVAAYASAIYRRVLLLGKRLAGPTRTQKSSPSQDQSNSREK